ncbi:MAG: hypothetical protein IH600_18320 [Bacteroidetes bacterium]|nr:hypothetical protein [Bacteroidota bacterium]
MTELEHLLTSAYKDEMIVSLAAHPKYFDEAMELAISDNQPYSWRAAWLLFDCMDENDARVKKYIHQIIRALPDRADGHQRELLKILLRMELGETHEARLFDICVTLWEAIHKSPSVRFTAFKFIVRLVKKYPELSNEIAGLTQAWYLDSLSPGVKRSILRMASANRIRKKGSHAG